MVYIGMQDPYGEGDTLTLSRAPNAVSDSVTSNGRLVAWINLVDRGLLSTGAPIYLGTDPQQINQFFTLNIATNSQYPSPGQAKYLFYLTKSYPKGANPAPSGYSIPNLYYQILLNPTVLPNQEPRQLPRGVVIDLNNSNRPASWGSPGNYGTMDVLFSPNGTVTGLTASAGVINLVVADQVDVDLGLAPGVSTKQGNERIVSLRTQTGNIGVHNVDPTDVDGTPGPDDYLRFSALGETAK